MENDKTVIAGKTVKAEYKKVLDFLAVCGQAETPRNLVIKLVKHMGSLCAFDGALVYFLDGNGKVYNHYLMNVDELWSNMYLDYYASTDNNKYSILNNNGKRSDNHWVSWINWQKEDSAEFVNDFIRPRRLKYSLGFALYDFNDSIRVIVALDRTRDKNFSSQEFQNVSAAIPHLNHLHKNYYYQVNSQNPLKDAVWEETKLTPREIEIANLLCQGVTPTNISNMLCISRPTTYKHISNIYEKMNVSNRQEFLVWLFRKHI